MIRSYKNLEVYQRAFKMVMDIFWITKSFPKEEIYSLTAQISKSSRSVSVNVSEAWAKRTFEPVFKQHLFHALGLCGETETRLDSALECNCIDRPTHEIFTDELNQIGKMLNKLHQNWKSHGK